MKKLPVILQQQSYDCGPACLAMILAYRGRHRQVQALRATVEHQRPLSLSEISHIAEQEGLVARCLRCEPEDLTQVALPAILHIDFEHFVVLEQLKKRVAVIVDPALGRLELSHSTLSKRFTGVLIELIPGSDFRQQGELRRYPIWPIIKKIPSETYLGSLLLLVLLSAVAQGFALVTPFFLQLMVDDVLLVNNLDMAGVLVIGFALVYLIAAVTQWLRGLIAITIGTKISYLMSAGLHDLTFRLKLGFFRNRSLGDITSRFSSIQPLGQFLTEGLVRVLIDTLMVVTTFAMICAYSISIAGVVLLLCLTYIGIQYLILLPYRRYQHQYLVGDAELQTHFLESVQTIATTRRFEATAQRQQVWLNQLNETLDTQFRARRWALGGEILRHGLTGALTLAVVGLAAQEVIAGNLTLGMLYTLTAYTSHLTGALISLAAEWQSYLLLAMHVQRLSDITEASVEARAPLTLTNPVRELSLDQLSFGHDTNQGRLFQNLTINLSGNDNLAIVGPSGCGKSTLLSIIRGEQQPVQGNVKLNGLMLQEHQNPAASFSVLTSDDRLLRATVRENISYLDPMPNEQRILAVTELVELHQDILKLPLGYREPISEDSMRLSSGQKQRLMIARCLYRADRVLLLDEATSHLDPALEHRIMRRILALPGLCLFVTHTKPIARLADHVLDLATTGLDQDQPATIT